MQTEKKLPGDPVEKAAEALRRARNVINSAKQVQKTVKEGNTKSSGMVENVSIIADALHGIRVGCQWINETIIQPIAELPYIGPAISSPIKFTYRGYYKFTHPYEGESMWQSVKNMMANPFRRRANRFLNLARKNKIPFEPDQRVRGPLSKHRAGIAALMSAWALTGALSVPIAGDSFNYIVAEPMVDLTRISLTIGFNGISGHGFGLTRDTLYYGVPSKETGDDIYHVTGSTQRHSDESNSISFEVRDRLVHELWSWTNGHGPYRPDYVVGPIRPDSNKCDTISYGSRFRLARWASFRPEMLSVSCHAAGPEPGSH